MPSIEIRCIGQTSPTDCASYSFGVHVSGQLISDRIHSSRFQSRFDELSGYMYRLHEGTGRTAYELLKKDWYDADGEDNGIDDNIEFTEKHDSSFINLINKLVQSSPVGEIVFTSDYQFGPEEFEHYDHITILEFLSIYEKGELRMNSLYRVKKC